MRIAIVANFPLHVLPRFEGERVGHHATWLPQLSEQFAAETDFDLHWIVIARKFISHDPLCWRRQTFHFLHNPRRLRLLRGYAHDCRLIRKRIEQVRPDLVHAWGSEDCYGFAGSRCGRPWLFSLQGLLQEYIRRAPMHPFVHIQAWYEKSILKRARTITAESPWAVEQVQKRAPQARVSLVDYGVQEPFFATEWRPDPDRPSAVFVGTPDERKGIQDAIAAFRDPLLNRFRLSIVGNSDSSFGTRLKTIATENVRWLGNLSQAETAQAMAGAWCMVMPTRADTGPTVVKEARVIGLPVITTPHGGQRDYVTDGVNGFHVEPGDIPELVNKLHRVLGDYATAQEMGRRRHLEQRDYFRPENTALHFKQLYREFETIDAKR